jgi:O-antigen/teichoic acid export membrane protein
MVVNAVVIGAGALPAQVVLVGTGKTKELSRIYLGVGLVNVVVMPLLIYRFSAIGAAVALTLAESAATWQMIRLALAQRPKE